MTLNVQSIRDVKPKILIWDVETSSIDILERTYDLKVQKRRFDPSQIIRDWIMLGVAWKWLDEDRVYCVSVTSQDPLNDIGLVRHLHGVLSEADVIVGHNSDAFDLKKFNTRAIYHKLSPVKPLQSVDTLKVARKYFRFTSNKLRYLADYLGVESKEDSPDWDLCLEGCPEALRYMRQYNKQDVLVTEKIYKIMRSWHHTHPNTNVMHGVVDSCGIHVDLCPKCGSNDVVRNGYRKVRAGKRQQYICHSCGGHHTGKKTIPIGEYR